MKQIRWKCSLILLLAVLLLMGGAGAVWAGDAYEVTVNQNTRIDVQLTDADGRAVAPGREIDDIKYIIKSKPEGARASAYTVSDSELEETGRFTMAFTCDTVGTVEVESFVTVKGAAKYYTGLHTIQVVDEKAETEKIIIMSIGSAQMIVNNDVIQIDAAPLVQNGRTYVPLRALSDIFEARCSYDAAAQQITITKDNTVITMTIGADQFTLDGTVTAMDAPAFITGNGRTMVPVRFIANAFGAVIKPTYHENGAVADIMLQL